METTTSKDGTTIGYQMSGVGPPLILVHGTTADHHRWVTVSLYLEPHFTLYAMDRRGRGGSSDGPVYGLLHEAEDVAAVANSIGRPVSLLGHSYGGLCSLEASLLTDKIQKLVLYEPPVPSIMPISPPGVLDRIQSLADKGELEAGLEVFFREVVKMPEYELKEYRMLPMWQRRITLVPTIVRELNTVERIYQFDPGKFASLKAQVLLLLGGDSPPFMKKATEMIHDALPNSQIVVLAGQQHIAMDRNPKLFTEKVLQFLSQ